MDQMASSPAVRLADAVARLAGRLGATDPAAAVASLDDEALLSVLGDVTDSRKALDVVAAAASAEVARRSARELGYRGLAQRKGHRNVTSLVQNITGQSKGDVFRSLRTGEELLDARGADADAGEQPVGGPGEKPPSRTSSRAPRWLALLRDALSSGQVGAAQFQAIRIGLGDPPVDRYPDLAPDFLPDAWQRAVERLLHEAGTLPVEELRNAARIARDRLDPVGVTLRFEERFTARSYRKWTDENGQHHARIVYDDDGAAWAEAIINAALRPRRGPRFVGSDAAARTKAATEDERTNEQVQYDTFMAILRTGANADPSQAFGDKQPGVRIIVESTAIQNPDERGGTRVTGVGHLEDTGGAVPAGVVEKYLCDAGAMTADFDGFGRPLDLGREQRLFTAKQRIVIAARDGGCMWPSCSAPPAWCEYHHVDHWWEHHGRTDVDDGVPLCRNCHMRLHTQGWRITRTRDPQNGTDAYWLHPPPDTESESESESESRKPDEPIRLEGKSPRRFEAVWA